MNLRKIAIPISGIDDSMIGWSIKGWKIIRISEDDKKDDTVDFAGVHGKDCLGQMYNLLHWDSIFDTINFLKQDPDFRIIALSKETDLSSISFKREILSIIDAFRLFKTSKVGFSLPFDLTEQKIERVLHMNAFQYDPFDIESSKFTLSPDETELFSSFFDRLYGLQYSNTECGMIQFFHESCKTNNKALRYVIRITIMEMLIDGNAELAYRLGHSLSVFLGRDLEESKELSANIKKMYNARSKYLHEGDESKITDEYCRLAFEYSRRLIANLIMTQDDIQEVRTRLNMAGYGTNPYQVQF